MQHVNILGNCCKKILGNPKENQCFWNFSEYFGKSSLKNIFEKSNYFLMITKIFKIWWKVEKWQKKIIFAGKWAFDRKTQFRDICAARIRK